MPKDINVKKIIINASHELTDIAKEIHNSKAERVVLTFTDQTDILISPINLKVLREVAQREGKLLIAQIIQNPTGVRNSKLAGIKVIETPSSPTLQDWEDAAEEIVKEERELVSKKKVAKLAKEEEAPKSSAFEERVNSVLNKSKEEYEDRRGIKPDTSFISINKDIPSAQQEESLAGKDFAPTMPDVDSQSDIQQERRFPRPKFKGFNFRGINFKDKKTTRILLILLAVFILLPGSVFAIYNQMVPLVKVKIFVEAKPIEIEKIFVGDPNIEEIDFDNLKIPIKTEEIDKTLSGTINPTGKAFKGDKAKGVVTLTYNNTDGCGETNTPISLAAGHKITATTGESYKLITAVQQLTCPDVVDVNVEAVDIGTEYNINSGKSFSVAGYSSSLLSGFNKNTFTGGTKEEHTVLSQQDLDNAVKELSETAIEEMKSTLREKESSWEIIENSIKSQVEKDGIKTDKKVGEEATVVNLEITIKGTATYYLTKDLNDGLTALLREEATEQNLFETENEIELELGEKIEKELTVDDTKTPVEIKLIAKSSIRPKIDKEEIEKKLKSMGWHEGLDYITTLDFSEQKTEVLFIPTNYPELLKRFPNRRGGVLLSIVELKSIE
ncbi:MAG: hypothetical protein ACOX0X_01690 [Candidatus Dojkabacteria bacterium]